MAEIGNSDAPWQHRVGLLETIMTTYFVGGVTSVIVLEQYIYQRFLKAASSGLDGNVTMSMDQHSKAETEAGQESATWIMYIMVAPTLPALVSTVLLGGYSDGRGRKPVLLCVCLATFVRVVIVLAVTVWDLQMWWLLVGYFVEGLGGGAGTAQLILLSMVADIHPDPADRTRRIAILESMNGLVTSIAPLPFSYFIQATDYWCAMAGTAGVLLVSVALVATVTPETRHVQPGDTSQLESRSFRRALRIYLARIPGTNRRASLLICVLMATVVFPMKVIKRSVETLYTLKSPFCWTPVKLGVFITTSMGLKYGAVLALMRPLQSCCSNVTIMMYGLATGLVGLVIEGFAQSDVLMYAAAGMGFLALVCPPLIHATLSNLVSSHEQGGMFSVVICIKLLTQPAVVVMVTRTYYATLVWYPGFIFHAMALVSGVGMVLLIFLKTLQPRQDTYMSIDDQRTN